MRRPSTRAQLYAWHSAALRGENPPRHEGVPECGWYKRRLVKGGPWVPARIYVKSVIDPATGELLEPEEYVCKVEGLPRDPVSQWTYLRPISREEYQALERTITGRPEMSESSKPLDLTKEPVGPNG